MKKLQTFGKLDLTKTAWIVFVFCAATTLTSSAQSFNTLASFDDTDGLEPFYMSLVQGTNGNLYGTTTYGGADSFGTVFSLSVGLGPFVETLPAQLSFNW